MDQGHEPQADRQELVQHNIEFVKALYHGTASTVVRVVQVRLVMIAHNEGEMY